MGASSVTTYVESGAGIAEGGRTGPTALVTAALFAPGRSSSCRSSALVGQSVPYGDEDTFVHPGVAPALVLVGYLMIRIVADIDWDRPEDAIPAFLVIVGIPMTFSIAAGIGFGVLGYVLVMVAQRQRPGGPPADVAGGGALRPLLHGRLAERERLLVAGRHDAGALDHQDRRALRRARAVHDAARDRVALVRVEPHGLRGPRCRSAARPRARGRTRPPRRACASGSRPR